MRPAEDIKRFIDQAAVSTHPRADKAVWDAVLKAHEKATEETSTATGSSLRSIVMRSPITKFAAAAVVIIAAALFIGLWDRSVPAAYAIEQTIEANRSVRYLHIKNFATGHEEPRQGWIEFGEDGQARKMRAYMPEWASPVDGPRVLVWKDGTVQTWLSKLNRLAVTKADSAQEQQLNATLQELDPRLLLARINDLKSQGRVEVAIEEPSDKTQPIVMTVTYLPGSDSPGQRKILTIDPATKLINLIEVYQQEDGRYHCKNRIELQEYNQPIDPEMFDLTNEAPANAERLDLSSTGLGLAQEQLSDEEAAVAVVRKFFESIQAGDYDAADRLVAVGPGPLREHFSAVKILRIVSVGPATPLPGPGNKQMAVPCTIEFEADGRKRSITLKGITVQQLPMQPDHWMIENLNE